MRSTLISLFFITAILLWPGACRADHLKVYAEELAPYAYQDGDTIGGFVVEIVQELLRRQGRDPHMIQIVPWARGMRLLIEQKEVALFPVPGNEAFLSLNRLVGPIFRTQLNFYSRSEEAQRFSTLEDARRAKRISVPREGTSFDTLTNLGFDNLEESNGHQFDFYKLAAGRSSLAVMDKTLFPGFLERYPRLNLTQFADTGITFATFDMYIAFSRDMSQAMLARWQTDLDAMKADGTYKAILKRHL